MNWPLYIAPTPGISPRNAASAGWGAPAGGATKGGCTLCHAVQHGSQKICPPGALRTQPEHSAFPQFWQYAAALTPLWFTQSIPCSFPTLAMRSHRSAKSPETCPRRQRCCRTECCHPEVHSGNDSKSSFAASPARLPSPVSSTDLRRMFPSLFPCSLVPLFPSGILPWILLCLARRHRLRLLALLVLAFALAFLRSSRTLDSTSYTNRKWS